jgi:hypothetical protein
MKGWVKKAIIVGYIIPTAFILFTNNTYLSSFEICLYSLVFFGSFVAVDEIL